MGSRIVVAWTCVAFSCLRAGASPAPTSSTPLERVGRETLCVTNGVVSSTPDGQLAIDTPSSRGVLRVGSAQTAEIRFRFLGPSAGAKPLASGELRRQIGIKLLAQDTCNLVYAMWHIEPDLRVAVSVKRNPGQHTHEECGAHGYLNVKPRRTVGLSRILPGESHALRAELHGAELSVLADGQLVWQGTLGDAITDLEGPVGFRTDNARFVFQYYVSGANLAGSVAQTRRLSRCLTSKGD